MKGFIAYGKNVFFIYSFQKYLCFIIIYNMLKLISSLRVHNSYLYKKDQAWGQVQQNKYS